MLITRQQRPASLQRLIELDPVTKDQPLITAGAQVVPSVKPPQGRTTRQLGQGAGGRLGALEGKRLPPAGRTLHERALAIHEARLGADHPDSVRSRERLAAVVADLENRR